MIKNKLIEKRPLISFEIFPPKKEYPVDTIFNTIDELQDLQPDFISVTYGAGGSTKDKTVEISSYIEEKYNLIALAHLTCLTSTYEQIEGTLKILKQKGIRNILALRGDYPQNPNEEISFNREYKYAVDLIKQIKNHNYFSIGGACYPEKHMEAETLQKDIINLKNKVDEGLDFLITQLFFNNEIFYDYKNKVEKAGIKIPIIVGILPILNKNQVEKIVSLSGCTLSKKILRILNKYEHNPEALKEAGIAYATEQIIDLLSWGVDGIHIYTMNKSSTARTIVNNVSTIREVLTDEYKGGDFYFGR